MKVTLICTVLNEEENIDLFIKSILFQSRKIDEIILVDAGSADQTVEIIKKYSGRIKLIIKKGNRSVGRNEAIKRSSNEVIVCSDAGSTLDKNWVRNIIKPFEDPTVDVVAGYYKGNARNIFEKCLIPYVLVMPDKTNNNFLPATRSMAFRKSIWKKAGKFPEEFSNNEDYVFAKKLKKINANIVFKKNAIVFWRPRNNIKDAFTMFYRFAFGDAQARILRPKVFLIFLRYIAVFYLFFLFFLMKSFIPLYGVISAIFIYVIWSIFKNYRYVKDIRAFFIFPLLQVTSDTAVLSGTVFGTIRSINIKNMASVVRNNIFIVLLIGLYAACMVLFINWGIPGNSHPFNYFMDEWHQAQSVRSVFTQGSPNISGSANGSMFHFFLSGIYLLPFIAVGIFNPLSIKSSIDSLGMQEKLFEILRLNTLLFGVFSIILIAYIAKKYFRLNPFWTTFLFTVNPIFLTLSNYFKYDIALIFWIILSFLFLLKYSTKPNSENFFLGSFFSGIALSVKVSAISLLPIMISAFLLFDPDRRKHLGELAGGVLIFLCVFLLFGIPDLILGKGNVTEYLYDNLIRTPSYTQNYILGMPYWTYSITRGIPSIFGTFFSLFSLFGFVLLVINVFKKKLIDSRRKLHTLILITIIFFILSLVPLQIEARGNRLLVLLPFMALLGGLFVDKILRNYSDILRKILNIIFVSLLLFQTIESLSWLYIKQQIDPRQESSEWIINNIPPKSIVGIENIPIYQSLSDIIVKEFYYKKYDSSFPTRFDYQVIDSSTVKLPSYVVISNEESIKYLKESSKKNFLTRLMKERYKKEYQAHLNLSLLKIFRREQDYFMSGILQSPISISIYKAN